MSARCLLKMPTPMTGWLCDNSAGLNGPAWGPSSNNPLSWWTAYHHRTNLTGFPGEVECSSQIFSPPFSLYQPQLEAARTVPQGLVMLTSHIRKKSRPVVVAWIATASSVHPCQTSQLDFISCRISATSGQHLGDVCFSHPHWLQVTLTVPKVLSTSTPVSFQG